MIRWRTARWIYLIVGATVAVMSCSPAFSEWSLNVEEAAEGTRCALTTLSSYQEGASVKRNRSAVSLVVRSFDPLVADFEIDSGFQTSLKTIGALKIGDKMFVFDFVGSTGKLRDHSQLSDLVGAIRTGEKMPALFQNSQRNTFDQFIIRGLDKSLVELRKECPLKS